MVFARNVSALVPLLALFPAIISFYVPQIHQIYSLPSASFEPACILAVPADDEELFCLSPSPPGIPLFHDPSFRVFEFHSHSAHKVSGLLKR
ncbi:hypothetical protein C8J57DRAFT_1529045 [Mycena rebaudengoi]|nr:hypothetical protein C8J57DRAFT_1529045 [Mycena rebaudengoi]